MPVELCFTSKVSRVFANAMTISHCTKRIAAAALLCLSAALVSCGTTVGSSHVSSTDPKIAQAKKELLDSLGDMTVNNQWVNATKFNMWTKRDISSSVVSMVVHYSGWRCGDDNILRGHFSTQRKAVLHPNNKVVTDGRSGEMTIPIRNVASLYVHDHEAGSEMEEAFLRVAGADVSGGVGLEQRVSENSSHTATVEFVIRKGARVEGLHGPEDFDTYQRLGLKHIYARIYFPNRQRAEAFVAKWNQLVAASRKS